MPERGDAAARLEALWYGAAPVPLGLRLLSRLNGGVLALRRRAYEAGLKRRTRLPAPVIVVGNLTVGGTGKTPLTAWVVEQLSDAGHAPGIASRGYGRSSRGLHWVEPDDDPAVAGDEPLMLRRQTGQPVCVAERRAEAGAELLRRGCDVVVCDDGLQHLSLERDLELAVVDGVRGLGNARLLPAGPLREPADRLRGVDAIVVNGPATIAAAEAAGSAGDGPSPHLDRVFAAAPGVQRLAMALLPGELEALVGGGRRPLASLAGESVHAVTGIGHPERFFAALRASGAHVREHAFPDHHRFVASDLAFPDALPVILTAKDAVKCVGFADPRLWVLPVRAHFPPADAQWLRQRVLGLFRAEDGA